jgi:hypothetical protein
MVLLLGLLVHTSAPRQAMPASFAVRERPNAIMFGQSAVFARELVESARIRSQVHKGNKIYN